MVLESRPQAAVKLFQDTPLPTREMSQQNMFRNRAVEFLQPQRAYSGTKSPNKAITEHPLLEQEETVLEEMFN